MTSIPSGAAASNSAIHLRAEDLERLSSLVGDLQEAEGVVGLLQEELSRAVVVDDNEPVVGLYRWIHYTDGRSDRVRRVKIVMPVEADIDAGLISPLSHVGVGLIGLKEGQSIDWPDPSGALRHLTVIKIEDAE